MLRLAGSARQQRSVSRPLAGGVALTLLSLASIGAPGTLLLLGGWLLAAAVARWVSGLQGPASWAAAVVVQLAVLTALTMVLAEASPHEHGSVADLLILAVPAMLGAAGLCAHGLSGRGAPTSGNVPRQHSRWGIAGTITGGGLLLPMWVASRGTNFGAAWATSGDARNHVQLVRQIMDTGGLTPSQLRGYPSLIDSLTALLSGAGGRLGLAPGRLMLHDIHAMAATYVISGIALALLIAAALLELLPGAVAGARRLPVAVRVLVFGAAWLSTTAPVLGTSLLDGYLSAYGTLPLSLAAVVLAVRCCGSPSAAAFGLLGPAAVLVFFSWTLLAATPVALVPVVGLVVVLGGGRRRWSRPTRRAVLAWSVATASSCGCAIALAAISYTHVARLHYQFLSPGSVTPPWHGLLYLLLAATVASVALAARASQRRQLLVPGTAAVVSIGTVRFLVWLSPDGGTWTYYAGKTLYLAAATLIWLIFLPVLLLLTRGEAETRYGRAAAVSRTAVAVAASVALVASAASATRVGDPFSRARAGWKQPTAAVLTEDAQMADTGQPFLLWHWTDGGNDKLGNFWAALTWSYDPHGAPKQYQPDMAGGIPYWAYVETGALRDLCRAATAVHGLYVVTRLPDLQGSLDKHCPGIDAHILIRTPPTAASSTRILTPSPRPTAGQ